MGWVSYCPGSADERFAAVRFSPRNQRIAMSRFFPIALFVPMVCLGLASTSSCQAQQTNVTSAPIYSTTFPSGMTVCPKCGKVHGSAGVPTTTSPTLNGSPTSGQPVSLQRTNASTGTVNVLAALNAQRARQGLRALQPDRALQAVAERRARIMASTRQKNHPPGSFAPGRYEGVGWNSSYSPAGVSACFTSDPNMTAAGAAMASGSDGVYFCVVYR